MEHVHPACCFVVVDDDDEDQGGSKQGFLRRPQDKGTDHPLGVVPVVRNGRSKWYQVQCLLGPDSATLNAILE